MTKFIRATAWGGQGCILKSRPWRATDQRRDLRVDFGDSGRTKSPFGIIVYDNNHGVSLRASSQL